MKLPGILCSVVLCLSCVGIADAFPSMYHDRFKHKDFTAADKAKNTEEAMKVFKAAWEKSITEKNADGKVYFELIKEGKLPGKND